MKPSLLIASAGLFFLTIGAGSASAQSAPFADSKIQAPELSPPSRGSLAGQYAALAFGPADVSRGAFNLALPVSVPSERGELQGSPVPTYSPDAAISEWGAGWYARNQAVFRSRLVGDVDYQTDERTGPWGRMVKGADGAWYPVGLQTLVRVEETGDTLVAHLPDGSQWTFGGSARLSTTAGTYAWYLQRVVTATGRATSFTYVQNASGRSFLTNVEYGGTGDVGQYRITFEYETLPLAIADYRSGKPVLLDRRVKRVRAQVASAGTFIERWHHDLSYVQDGASPAFYLASVQQVFASGEAAPATTYAYKLSRDYFASATPQRITKLDAVLQSYGQDLFLPNKSTALDVDLDGRPDLELQYDNRVLRQTDDGYAVDVLPPASPLAVPQCRLSPSSFNEPRLLARMRAGVDDQNVIAFRADAAHAHTGLTICSREGESLSETMLTGDWTMGPNARLVDLNRDHRPDLVRVFPGGYEAIANTSDASFSFEPPVRGALTPSIQADATWIHDFNGDGIADILSRFPGGVVAWMGEGNLAFESAGKVLPILTAQGQVMSNLKSYQFVFFDANNDGITDLLLSNGASVLLFANNGTFFGEVAVPALRSAAWVGVQPVVLDVAGNGNTEVAYVQSGLAYGIDLDAPGVGLLTSADDGRGTSLQFGYRRAAPEVGVRQRNSLLAQIDVASTGYDPVTYEYDYGAPHLHSVGKFLLGYDQVSRRAPLDTATMTFLNADIAFGLLLSSTEHDVLAPAVDRVEYREYDDANASGVPWKRLKSEGKGWKSTDPLAPRVLLKTKDYIGYDRDVCAAVVRESSAAGVLLTEKTFAAVPAYAGALACLDEHVVLTGSHSDASLDFRSEAQMDRNVYGQLTQLTTLDRSSGPLVQEALTYTADHLIETITTAGKGTTVYAYTDDTRLLRQITSADGVVTAATARDPVADAVQSLATYRGALAHRREFRFDGQERLASTWDNLGNASEALPNARFTYRYATATAPGVVQSATLIDAAAQTYRQSAEVFTANAESMAKAKRIPEGWAFDNVTARVRSQRQTAKLTRPVFTGDLGSLDMTALFEGGQMVKVERSSLAGDVISSSEMFHSGVERDVAATIGLDAALTRTEVENGALNSSVSVDVGQRTVARRDQSGAMTAYTYDALDRVRVVRLADGSSQRVSYDDHGHLASVVRDGVATVAYRYEPGTGLLAEKTFASPGGEVLRTIAYRYDAAGRTLEEQHSDVPGGTTKSYRFYFDGASPANPSATTALGLLTAVAGDAYLRTTTYRADGSVARVVIDLAGQRSIATETTYTEDGAPRERAVAVRDAQGSELLRTKLTTTRDAYGRESGVLLNDTPFAAYAYDVLGLPLWASFSGAAAHNEVVTLVHDSLTREKIGQNENAASWAASSGLRRNARGLVGSEDLTIAGVARARAYDYSPPGFLARAADVDGTYDYAFDATGLPIQSVFTEGAARDQRDFVRTADVLVAGAHHHRFDGLGRAIELDDVAVGYGADGQIATAHRGDSAWSYLYDEKGQRVAKLIGGEVTAAYLPDGSIVDGAVRTEPVRFDGTVVGVLRHGIGGGGASALSTEQALSAPGTESCETLLPASFDELFGLLSKAKAAADANAVSYPSSDAQAVVDGIAQATQQLSDLVAWQRSVGYSGTNPSTADSIHSNVTQALTPLLSASRGAAASARATGGAGAKLALDSIERAALIANELATRGGRCYIDAYVAGTASPVSASAAVRTCDALGAAALDSLAPLVASANASTTADFAGHPDDAFRSYAKYGIDLTASAGRKLDALRTAIGSGTAADPATASTIASALADVDADMTVASHWAAVAATTMASVDARAAFESEMVASEVALSLATDAARCLAAPASGTASSGVASAFLLVATDARGSALSDAEGAARASSPFGDRTSHPDVAVAIDYAAKGYDADLGVVRMGVRDYDAKMSRFTTPDPLFLENIGRCVESSVDCNLYAYAKSNPLSYVDPTGEEGIAISVGLGSEVGVGPIAGTGSSVSVGVYMGTEGVRFFRTVQAVTPYVGTPKEGTVTGIAVGGAVAVDAVKDGNALAGEGRQMSAELPEIASNVGMSDGHVNSVGYAVGKGPSGAYHDMPNYTFASGFYHPIAALKSWWSKL